jgi:hypothetical protein
MNVDMETQKDMISKRLPDVSQEQMNRSIRQLERLAPRRRERRSYSIVRPFDPVMSEVVQDRGDSRVDEE